jgi:hypothetical protein
VLYLIDHDASTWFLQASLAAKIPYTVWQFRNWVAGANWRPATTAIDGLSEDDRHRDIYTWERPSTGLDLHLLGEIGEEWKGGLVFVTTPSVRRRSLQLVGLFQTNRTERRSSSYAAPSPRAALLRVRDPLGLMRPATRCDPGPRLQAHRRSTGSSRANVNSYSRPRRSPHRVARDGRDTHYLAEGGGSLPPNGLTAWRIGTMRWPRRHRPSVALRAGAGAGTAWRCP